jgi:uncharacterized protein (DUF1684 family)
MRNDRSPAVLLAIAGSVLAMACSRAEEGGPVAADYVASVEAWREKHDADYRRDWVTISGLHPLAPGPNTAGSAPANDIMLPASTPATVGQFILDGPRVRFEPAPAGGVTLRDQPVAAPIDLRDDADPDADELSIGDVRLIVHLTGESRTLRVRDPNGPPAQAFAGFTWFPIDHAYRVTGRFVADAQPATRRVLNTFGDIDEYRTEGVVAFRLHGQDLTLRPFTTRPNRLYFVFRDASSGEETYEAARFVYADLDDTGRVVIDFNQAYNPPCAFNPYTTCPIPLSENRLPVKILAGERNYQGRIVR